MTTMANVARGLIVRKTGLAGAVVLTMIGSMIVGVASPAAAAAAAAPTSWTPVATPNVGTGVHSFSDVSCATATFCVAVGQSNANHTALAEAWNGSAWSVMPMPDPTANDDSIGLFGVSCVSVAFCMAVGSNDDHANVQPIVERWNGSSWSVVSIPVGVYDVLSGVSCASTSFCVAVGSNNENVNSLLALAIKWNGSTWTRSSTPDNSNVEYLSDVSCTSSAFCMAVGQSDEAQGVVALVETWNGFGWSTKATPFGVGGNYFGSVWCITATSCFAVGGSNTDPNSTLAERWNGTAWTQTPSAAAGLSAGLLSVSCTSVTFCLAVGRSNSAPSYVTLVERWNGSHWSVVTSPNPGSSTNGLNGVACLSATSCLLVGSADNGSITQTLVERWTGSTVSVLPALNPGTDDNALAAVSCASASFCLAVGNHDSDPAGGSPLVEMWNGTAWTVKSSPSAPAGATSRLSAVSCASSSFCIAVGSASNAFGMSTLAARWNGAAWVMTTSVNPVRDPSFTSVSCTSSTFCVAVGQSWTGSQTVTLVETWNGSVWSVAASPSPGVNNDLTGVSCRSTTFCVAVGYYFDGSDTDALLEMWNGATWSAVPSANGEGDAPGVMSAVTCSSTTWCVGVGAGQSIGSTLVESWNGTAWSIVASPNDAGVTNRLDGVSCVGPTSCVAVGQHDLADGTTLDLVESWDGSAWTITPSPDPGVGSDDSLVSVSCLPHSLCVAVGSALSADRTFHTMALSGATAPDVPTGVSAVRGPRSGTVSWSAPADNGSPVSSYTVRCASSNGGAPGSTTGLSEPATVTGLTNGRSYTCTVAATNAIGTSPTSAASNTVVPRAAPGAPTSVSANPADGQATLTWVAPALNGGSAINGYILTPYLSGVAQAASTFGPGANGAVVTGLSNGASYTFKVAAENAVGVGAQSAASATILIGRPTAPANVVAVANTGRAAVRWTAPAGNGGSAITGYVVTPFIGTVAQTARSYASTAVVETVTGLTNGTQYSFKVHAVTALGAGVDSAADAPVKVGSPAVASAPHMRAVSTGDGQVTLLWSAPATSGSANVTGYVVTPYIASTAQPVRAFATSATTQVITGLTNGVAYTFRVAATSAAGQSAQSNATASVVVGLKAGSRMPA